jgi:hypothetical protein
MCSSTNAAGHSLVAQLRFLAPARAESVPVTCAIPSFPNYHLSHCPACSAFSSSFHLKQFFRLKPLRKHLFGVVGEEVGIRKVDVVGCCRTKTQHLLFYPPVFRFSPKVSRNSLYLPLRPNSLLFEDTFACARIHGCRIINSCVRGPKQLFEVAGSRRCDGGCIRQMRAIIGHTILHKILHIRPGDLPTPPV